MDERKKILQLLADKKITPDQATRLISAIKPEKRPPRERRLFIQVYRDDPETPIISVAIPVKIVRIGMQLIPTRTHVQGALGDTEFDLSCIDWKEIFELAARGEIGEILSIDLTQSDGADIHLRVFNE